MLVIALFVAVNATRGIVAYGLLLVALTTVSLAIDRAFSYRLGLRVPPVAASRFSGRPTGGQSSRPQRIVSATAADRSDTPSFSRLAAPPSVRVIAGKHGFMLALSGDRLGELEAFVEQLTRR